jgi:hypothetical protein
MNKPFSDLRNVSIVGLAAKIIFLVVMYAQLSEGHKDVVLTSFNWLVLAIYIGLCIFTFYCKKYDNDEYNFTSNGYNFTSAEVKYKVITNTVIRSRPENDSFELKRLNADDTVYSKVSKNNEPGNNEPEWCYVRTRDAKDGGWCLAEHLKTC